jgi:hypothetical protein
MGSTEEFWRRRARIHGARELRAQAKCARRRAAELGDPDSSGAGKLWPPLVHEVAEHRDPLLTPEERLLEAAEFDDIAQLLERRADRLDPPTEEDASAAAPKAQEGSPSPPAKVSPEEPALPPHQEAEVARARSELEEELAALPDARPCATPPRRDSVPDVNAAMDAWASDIPR